jgi:hypothetical protein
MFPVQTSDFTNPAASRIISKGQASQSGTIPSYPWFQRPRHEQKPASGPAPWQNPPGRPVAKLPALPTLFIAIPA